MHRSIATSSLVSSPVPPCSATAPAGGYARPFFAAAALALVAHGMFSYVLIIFCSEVGLYGFTSLALLAVYVPMCVMTLHRGVQADRGSKRSILLRAHLWSGAVLCGMAAVSESTDVWPLAALTLCACMLYGFSAGGVAGTRLALLPDIVAPSAVEKAMILLSVLTVLSLVVAPVLAGLLREEHGWTTMFAVPGGLLLLAGLLIGRVAERASDRAAAPAPSWTDFLSGVRYLRENRIVTQVLALAVAMWFGVLGPFQVLLPVHSKSVLNLSEVQRGILMAVFAGGLLIGGSMVALIVRRITTRGVAYLVLGGCGSLAFAGIALSSTPETTSALLFASGVALGALNALIPASIQLAVSDAFRGRVMSIYAVLMLGCPALGGSTFSVLSEATKAGSAIGAAGSAAAIATAWMVTRPNGLRRLRTNAPSQAVKVT